MQKQPKGRPSIVAETADALARFLVDTPNGETPTLLKIAHHLGVSTRTAARAVHVLRARGIVQSPPGHRISTRPASTPDTPAPVSGAARLLRMLTERLGDGTYRSGAFLPKVHTLRAEFHVSDRTVVSVLRQMRAGNLIHRTGRRHVAGPPPSPRLSQIPWQPPVVLLIEPNLRMWKSLGAATRTARFCAAVSEGLEVRGMHMQQVLTRPDLILQTIRVPCGIGAAGELVRSLGSRYRGALIAGSSREITDLRDWAAMLCGLGQPVVWFDRHNEREAVWVGRHSPHIVRASYSENAAVACAVNHLRDFGHTVVAYVNPIPMNAAWKTDRGQELKLEAARSGTLTVSTPAPSHILASSPLSASLLKAVAALDTHAPIREIFDYFLGRFHEIGDYIRAFAIHPGTTRLDRILAVARFLALGGGRLGEERDIPPGATASEMRKMALLSGGPKLPPLMVYNVVTLLHLAQVLRNRAITALVVPSDSEADRIYNLLRSAGRNVPDDISLLSFDNSPSLQPYPIDSVDFGFGHQGYCALHTLLGDIPIRRDRTGRFPLRPHVVIRGSVRPARSPRLCSSGE